MFEILENNCDVVPRYYLFFKTFQIYSVRGIARHVGLYHPMVYEYLNNYKDYYVEIDPDNFFCGRFYFTDREKAQQFVDWLESILIMEKLIK